jgi:hypothetical protein
MSGLAVSLAVDKTRNLNHKNMIRLFLPVIPAVDGRMVTQNDQERGLTAYVDSCCARHQGVDLRL